MEPSSTLHHCSQSLPVSISEEHTSKIKEIEKCFPGINLEMTTTRRFSATELALAIAFPIGYWIAAHLLDDVDQFFWETFKRGVKKLFKRFTKIGMTAVADVEYVISANGKVRAIVPSEKEKDFAHIKDLDDLIQHLLRESRNVWEETTLGAVAEIIGGGTPQTRRPEYWNGGIPWLSVADFNDDNRWVEKTEKTITDLGLEKSSTKLLEKGDLILSARGTVGALAQLKVPMAFNQSCYGIKSTSKSDTDFLYYLFKFSLQQIKKNVHGSVFDTITRETFDQIIVSFPPLDEQRRIAAVLTSLDNKIDLLQAQSKTLEAIAQTLFKEWFPVNTESGKDRVDNLVEFNPREKIDSKIECLFFDMKCLSNQTMEISDGIVRTVSSASSFRVNDTLMAKITPCLENGKTGFVFDLRGNTQARGSTEFIVMRAKASSNPYFVYCLARSENFRDFAIKSMTGTSGRQRVQINLLRNYEIFFSEILMNKFGEVCEPIFNKIKDNVSQIQTLTALRDLVLPRLMRGELRIQF